VTKKKEKKLDALIFSGGQKDRECRFLKKDLATILRFKL
jgi:hypothetical protein